MTNHGREARAEDRVCLLPYDHFVPSGVHSQRDTAQFFRDYFGRTFGVLTPNGRTALDLVLQQLGLARSDEVCVLTTFDYPNVSSCVSCTIFNHCKPSRVLTAATRAVLVIHEFGVPYPEMDALAAECRARGLPLIEDCAHTIDSWQGGKRVGSWGDWIICSFSKILPVAGLGMVLGLPVTHRFRPEEIASVGAASALASGQLDMVAQISEQRRAVYRDLTREVRLLGMEPAYEITDEIAPWFFPLASEDPVAMMVTAAHAGVECGRWHGTNLTVFPCHQYMTAEHVKRIAAVVQVASKNFKPQSDDA